MGYVLKWHNNYSGEEGFVMQVSNKNQYFVNTYEIGSARQYASENMARKVIRQLETFGQGSQINNSFEIIAI